MAHIPAILARSFSTSGVAQQMVKAPIQVFGVEGRYASALYSAASKQKQLEQVEKDLKDIHGTLKKQGRLNDLLLNPSMNRNQKREIIISAMATTKASKLTGNLLALLAENGKLGKLEAIAASYFTIMGAHRGEVVCEVTSAKALDAPMQQELQTVLKSFVKSGQSIILNSKVDPNILGGMIVSIGDKYVDMSTASKIKKYTELIQQAV